VLSKKLKPANRAKSKSTSKDPIFVIDDDEDDVKNGNSSDSPLIISTTPADPMLKSKVTKPMQVDNSMNKKAAPNSSYIRKKKMRIENKEVTVISIDNPPPAVQAQEKKMEIETKDKSTDSILYYQTKYDNVEPMDYYLRNNPGKNRDDFERLRQVYKKETEGEKLSKDDQKSVLDMLKEFYEEKAEQYNLCTCQYCNMLNLPFLVRKDINENEELQTLSQKHGEYCNKHFADFLTKKDSEPPKDLYNIFFKKVYLGEVKCKNTTG